ncbi:MAG: Fic family protein [Holosporales bacterium]|nr:Fic family protein [Holosporales bacterium]
MINLLAGINYRLLGEKKAPPSPFRDGLIVSWNDAIGIPNFNEPTRMRGYLKNSPTELELYNKLCTLLEKQRGEEALSSTDEWNIFMINNIFKDKESPYLYFVSKYYEFNDLRPQEIKIKVQRIMNSYKNSFAKDPLRTSAMLHLELIKIHPFTDANGRTARILMNIGLKSAGYPTVIIYDRDEYVRTIRQALKQENPGIFVDYIKAQICKQVELYNNPEFKEGHALKEIADECMFGCSQTFFEASKKFGL